MKAAILMVAATLCLAGTAWGFVNTPELTVLKFKALNNTDRIRFVGVRTFGEDRPELKEEDLRNFALLKIRSYLPTFDIKDCWNLDYKSREYKAECSHPLQIGIYFNVWVVGEKGSEYPLALHVESFLRKLETGAPGNGDLYNNATLGITSKRTLKKNVEDFIDQEVRTLAVALLKARGAM